LAMGPYFSSI